MHFESFRGFFAFPTASVVFAEVERRVNFIVLMLTINAANTDLPGILKYLSNEFARFEMGAAGSARFDASAISITLTSQYRQSAYQQSRSNAAASATKAWQDANDFLNLPLVLS